MKKHFRFGRTLVAGALSVSLLASCAAVNTTSSGAVGVERKQYMSGLVSEAELNQTAAQQYAQTIQKARSQGAVDVDAAQTKRVRAISQRLVQQVGVFRPDAAN